MEDRACRLASLDDGFAEASDALGEVRYLGGAGGGEEFLETAANRRDRSVGGEAERVGDLVGREVTLAALPEGEQRLPGEAAQGA